MVFGQHCSQGVASVICLNSGKLKTHFILVRLYNVCAAVHYFRVLRCNGLRQPHGPQRGKHCFFNIFFRSAMYNNTHHALWYILTLEQGLGKIMGKSKSMVKGQNCYLIWHWTAFGIQGGLNSPGN